MSTPSEPSADEREDIDLRRRLVDAAKAAKLNRPPRCRDCGGPVKEATRVYGPQKRCSDCETARYKVGKP